MSIAKLAVLSVAALPVFALSGNALAGDAPLPTGIANPKVYVFPLIGQMGTDISEPIFKKLIEDAKKQKPDILVLKLKSADIDRINHLRNDNPVEFGLVNKMTEYRDMMKSVHDDLSDIPQVMWVEDSVGVSGLAALAWDRMYMFSDARLGGLYQFKEMVESQWDDADVRSKMVAAWTGIMKGLTQLGNNPDILADISKPGKDRPKLVVGFAAETASSDDELLSLARAKAARKGCDLLVVNDVGGGRVFGQDETTVRVLAAGGEVLAEASGGKSGAADAVLDEVAKLLPPLTPSHG